MPTSATAQLGELPPVSFPTLPSVAAGEAAFVPPGWTVAKRAAGDLDRDGRADLVLLLKMASKANVLPIADTRPVETFDTNPFLLAVAFARGRSLRLVATTHDFFARPSVPYSGDVPPGEGDSVRIERGTLVLSNEYLRGWDRFRFRWNGKDFGLIGYDSSGSSGGCVETISINYLTGSARLETVPISADKGTSVMRRVSPGPIPTLETFNSETFMPETVAGSGPPCNP